MRGFEYLMYSAFSLCLLVSLTLLPLAPVFADELTPEASTAPQETVTEPAQEPEIVADVLPEVEQTQLVTPDIEAVTENVTDAIVEDPASIDETLIEDVVDTTLVPTEEVIDVISEEVPLADETVSPNEEVATSSPEVVSDALPDAVPFEDTASLTTATTSEESVALPVEVTPPVAPESTTTEGVLPDEALSQPPVTPVVNDENRFSFSKDECTLVGDGTFYCAKSTLAPEVIYTDRVFAAPDVDGDKEIYIEKNGALTQVTQNTEDDDAPYFDQLSDTIVWHRLIDGRYQIISYDIQGREETQITADRYNNMEPNRFGDALVWQGWVGNDWEIFLLEGDELSMLTDNLHHDITPSINGNHIMWQSFENDAWKIKVYDTRTKQTQTIEDSEGGSIENPRFVLVYDSKFESGDVETRGFDLESGKVVPLGSTPAPTPEKIPDPDQTGEKRALVTPPTQPKTKVDGEADDVPPPDDPTLDTGDLIIDPLLGSELDLSIGSSTQDTFASSTDVVVTPISEIGTSSIGHIEDLIITPYTEPIELDIDPQAEVASST